MFTSYVCLLLTNLFLPPIIVAPAPGGLFGSNPAPAPSGGLFGAPAAPAPAGGLFGAPTPAPGGFGAPGK
jgi:nuclear pore complex protein Nup98-Nup96